MNWLTMRWLDDLSPDNAMAVILEDGQALVDAGYEACELPTPHLEAWHRELGESFWRELGERLREIGMLPIGVHGPNWPSLQAVEKQGMDATLERLRWHARAAVALEVAAIVVHPSSHSHPHVCAIHQKLLDQDLQLAAAISDELADSGVMLAIENLPTYGFAYLEHLVGQVKRPNVGVCFDTGHWHLRPEGDSADVLKRIGQGVGVYVHWSDNHGLCDEHLPPGRGTFDFAAALQGMQAWPRGVFRGGIVELSTPHVREHDSAVAETRRIRLDALECGLSLLAS